MWQLFMGIFKWQSVQTNAENLDDLKVNIEREIINIKQDVLKSTVLNFRKILNLIIEAKGGHIEQK